MSAELDLHTSIPAVIGSLIAKRRIERDLSQTDAAHFLDIGTSSWSRIESGETSMTIDQLFAICKGLDLKPSGFFILVEDKIALLESKGVIVHAHKLKAKKKHKIAAAAKKKGTVAVAMEVTGMGLWPLIGSVIFVAGAGALLGSGKRKRTGEDKLKE
jgi:transcriptional regulator with XRE-family HTH domain